MLPTVLQQDNDPNHILKAPKNLINLWPQEEMRPQDGGEKTVKLNFKVKLHQFES